MAQEVAHLLGQRYKNGKIATLICDNPNTHTLGAFCEAFPPEKTHAYLARLDLQYTPKHGSWPNIAENELSAMTRQCLAKRRIHTIDLFNHEIVAWYHHVNSKQKGVVWYITTELARDKLKSLYPVLSC